MLSRFIVNAADLDALRTQLDGKRIELAVIASPDMFDAVSRARRDGWATIANLEVPLGDRAIASCLREAQRAQLDDLPIYVELSRERLAMQELAEYGLRAKLRCGGVEPSAYPSVGEVAAFIGGAATAGVPFKATAGLHHPVRHFNEEAGVVMHGFLNVLLAAGRAGEASRSEIAAIIAEEDPKALPLRDEAVMRRARQRFIAYGSCSFDEPVADLRALGVLSAE